MYITTFKHALYRIDELYRFGVFMLFWPPPQGLLLISNFRLSRSCQQPDDNKHIEYSEHGHNVVDKAH